MTYSIVARDPGTGQLGVAAQSHYFSTGSVVPWAESGVGAVATQAEANVGFGPRGLDGMRAGRAASDVLRELLAADPEWEHRQVAMIDASGRVAVHTGSLCISEAGHHAGESFSVQANMMARASAWPAMANAFEAAQGELVLKLLAALDAAEAEGGDVRGRQSAAIVVVKGARSAEPWNDRLFDLRVEDHTEPLAELRRLVELRRLYTSVFAAKDWPSAERAMAAMRELAPGNGEIDFWVLIAAANAGELERARNLLAGIPGGDSRWRELARRLVRLGRLSAEAAEKLGL